MAPKTLGLIPSALSVLYNLRSISFGLAPKRIFSFSVIRVWHVLSFTISRTSFCVLQILEILAHQLHFILPNSAFLNTMPISLRRGPPIDSKVVFRLAQLNSQVAKLTYPSPHQIHPASLFVPETPCKTRPRVTRASPSTNRHLSPCLNINTNLLPLLHNLKRSLIRPHRNRTSRRRFHQSNTQPSI